MTRAELERIELLAEIDALVARLDQWAGDAPDWPPAETARAMVGRLAERVESLRVRLDAPLVVATLGGTGTGKSALVNALLGAEIVRTGQMRPTTMRPTLVSRPDITPEMLGIAPDHVEFVPCDSPALADLVLIDCPDPDTAEDAAVRGSNLMRLRQILPHCDVLLVTTTQQKYRSARVAEELATAAAGARLVFVQTHADVEEDIQADWRETLSQHYEVEDMFLVDSVAALQQAHEGRVVQGQFAALTKLLTRQLTGTAAARIRRANFLDLVEELLQRCRDRIEQGTAAVQRLHGVIEQQRAKLGGQLAGRMKQELAGSRRQWESRLLGQVVTRWGLSPFSLVLRIFHGLGGLIAGSILWRARTPAQMALWGAVTGVRSWQKKRQQQQADQSADRAVANCFDPSELREAAIVLDGYAAEVGLPRDAATVQVITAEADQAAMALVGDVATQVDDIVGRLAVRHARWFVRLRYELALGLMLGLLLFRLGKNFFYDSWWLEMVGQSQGAKVLGLDFYLSAAFWLLAWCMVLLWLFTGRLRRGLRREIDHLAADWNTVASAAGVFDALEESCRRVVQFREGLDRLQRQVGQLRGRLASPAK